MATWIADTSDIDCSPQVLRCEYKLHEAQRLCLRRCIIKIIPFELELTKFTARCLCLDHAQFAENY